MAINNKITTLTNKNINLIQFMSPIVGKIISFINNQKYLLPSAEIASIKNLNNIFIIISPKNIEGEIQTLDLSLGQSIYYNQLLLSINKKDTQINEKTFDIISNKNNYINESYLSPMDGLFYLKPSPNEPYFIKEGDIIKQGDTLGLIEVMKCFYELKYEKTNEKRVNKIFISNESLINTGDKLFEFNEI